MSYLQTGLMYLFSLLIIAACSTSQKVSNTSKEQSGNRNTMPDIRYFGDMEGSGIYTPLNLAKDDVPTPVQGKDIWIREFYKEIKYPADARENGVQGVVILNVFVDQDGQVTNVEILKGLSAECDGEAKRAFLSSITKGYTILSIEGKPLKFRIELPVGFWLG